MKLTIYFCAMTKEDLMRKAIELSKKMLKMVEALSVL